MKTDGLKRPRTTERSLCYRSEIDAEPIGAATKLGEETLKYLRRMRVRGSCERKPAGGHPEGETGRRRSAGGEF